MYQDEDDAVVMGVGVGKKKNKKWEIEYKIQGTIPIACFVLCNSERLKCLRSSMNTE